MKSTGHVKRTTSALRISICLVIIGAVMVALYIAQHHVAITADGTIRTTTGSPVLLVLGWLLAGLGALILQVALIGIGVGWALADHSDREREYDQIEMTAYLPEDRDHYGVV